MADLVQYGPAHLAAHLGRCAAHHLDRPLEDQDLVRNDLAIGVPKTRRGVTYGEVIPDKILIFQRPIEMVCRTPAQVRDQVRRTVLHEIGHHLGLDEDELEESGY